MTERDLKALLQQRFSASHQRTLLDCLFNEGMELFTSPQILVENTDRVRSARQIGSVLLADGRKLGLFDVTVTDSVKIARNRKDLRELAAKYLDASVANGALVFYHNDRQADYRLSLIARYNEIDPETGDFKQQETKPKRYTFLLGPNESCTTAAKRLGDLVKSPRKKQLKDFEEAFSVERLNRDFFKEYRWHYERFWRYVTERESYAAVLRDPDQPNKDRQEKPIRDFAKKLLGRMVFLYFLQKKRWMGCSIDRDDWTDGNPFFIRLLFEQFPRPDHFYSQCLTVLYFQTLNRRRSNDRFEIDGMAPCRVPYLNGGLFDDAHERASHFDFPPEFFADLLDFFEQYNFTIDENEPDEQEIGIDPEMLGHIFENLLEENRDKGAFYTPKSIVYYICREALISYLGEFLPPEADIENFVKHQQVSTYLRQPAHANALNERLDAVRVCDPAIGSGAFPIAMLQEIFKAKSHIYPFRHTIAPFDPAEVKLGIIENNIYGVDLDSGAVDIARLRFWLTLVVDEDAPRQLPNLDYKIMQGNSLFEEFEGVDLGKVHQAAHQVRVFEPDRDLFGNIVNPQLTMTFQGLHDVDFPALIDEYFEASDPTRKKQLRTRISDHLTDHIDYNLQLREDSINQHLVLAGKADPTYLKAKDRRRLDDLRAQLAQIGLTRQQLADLQRTTERPYFLWHLFFQDVFANGGFDIVIGNPPYFAVSKQPTLKALQTKYETYESTGDIYALFYELGYRLLRPGGTLAYITGSSWLRSNYGKSMRQFFRQKTNPIKLIDFSDSEIFESATVRTTLFAFKREANRNQLKALRITRRTQRQLQRLDEHFTEKHIDLDIQHEKAWVVLTKEHMELKKCVESKGKPLRQWSIAMNNGLRTGLNEAFIFNSTIRQDLIEKDAKNTEIIKPLVRGRDLKRFEIVFSDQWILISRHQGKDELLSQYPAAADYLKQFERQLKDRGQVKNGQHHWLELDNAPTYEYLSLFSLPKLIWAEISKDLNFCYDKDGFYTNNKCFIITGENLKHLLMFFNSRLFRYCFEEDFPEVEGNARELRKIFMGDVPVIEPTPNEEARLEILADYLLYLHNITSPSVSPYVENKQVAILFEDIANHLVCELYFGDEMRQKGVDLASVLHLAPFANVPEDNLAERGAVINQVYQELQKPGSRVRQVLAEAPLECPETVGRILTTII